MWTRPGLTTFLDALFTQYDVAVWSSVTKRNIIPLARLALGSHFDDLVFILSQEDCMAEPTTSQDRPIFTKPLSLVTARFPYGIDEILLIDDEPAKCVDNPARLILQPTTVVAAVTVTSESRRT